MSLNGLIFVHHVRVSTKSSFQEMITNCKSLFVSVDRVRETASRLNNASEDSQLAIHVLRHDYCGLLRHEVGDCSGLHISQAPNPTRSQQSSLLIANRDIISRCHQGWSTRVDCILFRAPASSDMLEPFGARDTLRAIARASCHLAYPMKIQLVFPPVAASKTRAAS